MDLSLRAILMEIVLLGLRSPRPPLCGGGEERYAPTISFFRIALPPGPDVRPPLPPYPLFNPFLEIIGGQDGPVEDPLVPPA